MKHPVCPYIQRPYFSHAEHKLVTSILHGGFQWYNTSRLAGNELVTNTTIIPASATDRDTTQSYIKIYRKPICHTPFKHAEKTCMHFQTKPRSFLITKVKIHRNELLHFHNENSFI